MTLVKSKNIVIVDFMCRLARELVNHYFWVCL